MQYNPHPFHRVGYILHQYLTDIKIRLPETGDCFCPRVIRKLNNRRPATIRRNIDNWVKQLKNNMREWRIKSEAGNWEPIPAEYYDTAEELILWAVAEAERLQEPFIHPHNKTNNRPEIRRQQKLQK